MNVVAIHQPNYLPWLGYFGKMMDSDVFIFLDDAQYSKNSYTNRVQIRGSQGAQWLTQPVSTSGRFGQEIRETEFAHVGWGHTHLKTLRANYGRAPYAGCYLSELAGMLDDPGQMLSTCNERLIRWVCRALGLTTKLARSSDLAEPAGDPTQRLVQLVRAVGGDTYLSGAGGFHYQDLDAFERAGIAVIRGRSHFPEYPQLWGEFIPGLSIIDLLLNCGADGAGVIRRGR